MPEVGKMLEWVRVWIEVHDQAMRKRDAFADPLEGPEWQGLLWLLPLISRLSWGSSGERAAKSSRHERHSLSGWSRSSAVSRDAETQRRSAC